MADEKIYMYNKLKQQYNSKTKQNNNFMHRAWLRTVAFLIGLEGLNRYDHPSTGHKLKFSKVENRKKEKIVV